MGVLSEEMQIENKSLFQNYEEGFCEGNKLPIFIESYSVVGQITMGNHGVAVD